MFNFTSDDKKIGRGFLSDHSALFLILSNIIMIFFAIFENWDIITIMFIYWCQSVIIGIFTLFKMLSLKNPPFLNRVGTAFFFLIHYGGFHFGYFIFLTSDPFFGMGSQTLFTGLTVLFVVSIFFANHLFSFLYNGENDAQKKQSIDKVMIFPYIRIVPMHLTIIFGGIFLMSGAPQITLILFLSLKTVADVAMHVVEHRELVANKIKIILDREKYSAGDTIDGKVQFEFTRPVKANVLKVAFIAEKSSTQSINQESYKEIFYQDEKILSHENYYGNATYDFSIKIPNDIFIKSEECMRTGKFGQARKMAEKTQSWGINIHFQDHDKFSIKVILNASLSMDITKTQEIFIS